MMRYKKCLTLIISLVSYFAFASNVDAALCDKEHISQLKEVAKQVEVSYEYVDSSDIVNTYLISINLISDELYIVDEYKNKYYYAQSENGIVKFAVNSGQVEFTIHSSRCADYKLKSVRIKLPKFNTYSYRSECKELEEYELDVCNPWYQGTITDNSFNKTINEFLNPVVKENSIWNKVLDFFSNYYLHIISGIAVVILLVVGIVVHRKRSVLE